MTVCQKAAVSCSSTHTNSPVLTVVAQNIGPVVRSCFDSKETE